jgi:hypothetical protein
LDSWNKQVVLPCLRQHAVIFELMERNAQRAPRNESGIGRSITVSQVVWASMSLSYIGAILKQGSNMLRDLTTSLVV